MIVVVGTFESEKEADNNHVGTIDISKNCPGKTKVYGKVRSLDFILGAIKNAEGILRGIT